MDVVMVFLALLAGLAVGA